MLPTETAAAGISIEIQQVRLADAVRPITVQLERARDPGEPLVIFAKCFELGIVVSGYTSREALQELESWSLTEKEELRKTPDTECSPGLLNLKRAYAEIFPQ